MFIPLLTLVLSLGLLFYCLPQKSWPKLTEIGKIMLFCALISLCLRWHGELPHALK